MNLKKIIVPENICFYREKISKEKAIETLVNTVLDGTTFKKRRGAILDAVMQREAQMTTGMQNGIAIPHARTDEVDDLIVGIGISTMGIEFGCLDSKPAQIIILSLSPLEGSPHMQFLGEISQILKKEENRIAVIQAFSPQDAIKVFVK